MLVFFMLQCVCMGVQSELRPHARHYARAPASFSLATVVQCKKEDLKRLAAATGGMLLPNMADLEGEESFDSAYLGSADEVAEERIGDGDMLFIRGTKTSRAVSIVLRGANEFLLDEMDRSLHDVLCVIQRVLESKSIVGMWHLTSLVSVSSRAPRDARHGNCVPLHRVCVCVYAFLAAGGGAVESALSIYLDNFATTLGTKEQLAIKEFAEALLVIPKTLAVNAAQDATDLVAKLCSMHHASQVSVRTFLPRFPEDALHVSWYMLACYSFLLLLRCHWVAGR